MNAVKTLIVGLSLFMAFDLVAKPKDEAQVTLRLMDQGYTIRQATVDYLLKDIENGHYVTSDEPILPYTLLGEFYPYSNETSIKILDVVLRALENKETSVNIDRLIGRFVNDRLRPRLFVEKLHQIMVKLPPSEAKRWAAVALAQYASHRAEAVECLKELMEFFVSDEAHHMYTAFSLLKIGEHVEEAENVLIGHLKNPNSISVVLSIAENFFAKNVSDRLFSEIKQAIEKFPEESKNFYYPTRLARIDEMRRHKIITKDCADALSNVIQFPKK